MNIAIIGSGGREAAMAWKCSSSNLVDQIFVLPGNPGMDEISKVTTTDLPKADDELITELKEKNIELVMIGPEAPLVAGLSDKLRTAGFLVLGPSAYAAQLEGSKIWSKDFMNKYEIPTAKSAWFYDYDSAKEALENWGVENKGIVIKSDALAGGKGVVVTHDLEAARTCLYDFMQNPECTVKCDKILFEEVLVGKEVSVFALCDGENYQVLGKACDYKRVHEGDKGPNTGGMGCYTPVDWPSQKCMDDIETHVIKKVMNGMKNEGQAYSGILFCGLMIDGDTPNVVEFNVRFGDPETQTILPTMEEDFVELAMAAAKGELNPKPFNEPKNVGVHVVMCSGGYPSIDGSALDTGHAINMPSGLNDNANLFTAGVKLSDGKLVNSGGRVLGVSAVKDSLNGARECAYQFIEQISFKGAHYRRDIGE